MLESLLDPLDHRRRIFEKVRVALREALRGDPVLEHPPNILGALQDPTWFGYMFCDASWDGWKAFLASLFGLPMTEQQVDLFRQFTGRQVVPTAPSQEAWVVVGRRGGKSSIAALLATYLALFRDYRPYLAPGEMVTIPVIAADRRGARNVMNYIKGLIASVPAIKMFVKEQRVSSVEFTNRVLIEIQTGSFRTTRGYTVASVICDEIGVWYTDPRAVNRDKEVIRAVRPCMATIPGSLLIGLSSPYERRGVLFESFERHFGVDGDGILVWQAPTLAMNPTVDRRGIESEYAAAPVAAAAEYGAQFPSA